MLIFPLAIDLDSLLDNDRHRVENVVADNILDQLDQICRPYKTWSIWMFFLLTIDDTFGWFECFFSWP